MILLKYTYFRNDPIASIKCDTVLSPNVAAKSTLHVASYCVSFSPSGKMVDTERPTGLLTDDQKRILVVTYC